MVAISTSVKAARKFTGASSHASYWSLAVATHPVISHRRGIDRDPASTCSSSSPVSSALSSSRLPSSSSGSAPDFVSTSSKAAASTCHLASLFPFKTATVQTVPVVADLESKSSPAAASSTTLAPSSPHFAAAFNHAAPSLCTTAQFKIFNKKANVQGVLVIDNPAAKCQRPSHPLLPPSFNGLLVALGSDEDDESADESDERDENDCVSS